MSQAGRHRGARSFVIDTVVVAVTQLLLRLRGLVVLPLIVRFLGTASYGIWSQVVALATFLSALISLNFHLPLVREIAADRGRSGEVYTTLFLSTLAISGASLGVLWLAPRPIAALLLDSADAEGFVKMAFVLMLLGNVRILNTNLYRAVGLLGLRSAVELLSTAGEIVALVIVLQRGGSLDDVIWTMLIWNGAITAVQTVHCFVVAGAGRPRGAVLGAALRYALPLLPASFAIFSLDRIDRFIVGYYHGAEAVGVYSANYAVAGIVMLAQTPFQITLLPKIAELWDRDRDTAARYIEVSLTVFLAIAIPCVVGISMIAEPTLAVLGNAEMSEHATTTTLFIAGGVLLWGAALIQAQVFFGSRRTALWGAMTVLATVINLVLNFVLVPAFASRGAAAATLIAYAAIFLGATAIARPILRIHFDGGHVLACIVAAAGMAGFLAVVTPSTVAELGLTIAAGAVIYGVLLSAAYRLVPASRGRHGGIWALARRLVGR
jgi:O-antigen/teichoic acid export membrane protein